MTFGFSAAAVVVFTQIVKMLTQKFAPSLGNQRLYVLFLNLVGSILAALQAQPSGEGFQWAVVTQALLTFVSSVGIFSALKNGIQGVVDVKTVRTGGSISSVLVLILSATVLSSCITVPYKGTTELACSMSSDASGKECLVCAGDVQFKDAGSRHVEQTMCLTPAPASTPVPAPASP